MGVTLKCSGSGLAPGHNGMATVKVPCPNCQNINQLFFTPDDETLHDVKPVRTSLRMPQPSLN